MAHGRMGDYIVDYLAKQNIPLFSPLNVNRLVEEWESDKMGMNGGFMSQSIVTPEIDGAIRPFALLDIIRMRRVYNVLMLFQNAWKLLWKQLITILLCSVNPIVRNA